ncbi:MAG: capsid protein [Clostridia bacterium]|nr:capsid protein [Clostridia bacterium]
MGFKIEIDDFDSILKRRGLEEGGMVQKMFDSEVERLCRPYVPVDTHTLQNSPEAATDFGSGVLVYNTPYARRIYYTHRGQAANSAKPQDPRAGKLWLENMKRDNMDHLKEFVSELTGCEVE